VEDRRRLSSAQPAQPARGAQAVAGLPAPGFAKESGGLLPFVLRAAQLFAISPEGGAKTLVYLASSPEVADLSGGYFFKCRASAPAPQAEDDNAAKRLWRESAKLASIE